METAIIAIAIVVNCHLYMEDKIAVRFNLRDQPHVLHKVIPHIVSSYANELSVSYSGGKQPTRLGLIDPGLIVSLSSLSVSAINLLLTVRHRAKERDSWTQAKLIAAVNEELLKRSLIDASIVTIQNYVALTGEGTGPCVVEAKVGPLQQTFRMYIFQDKEIFTIELSARSVPNQS